MGTLEKSAPKASEVLDSHEVFDSIIAECKEGLEDT